MCGIAGIVRRDAAPVLQEQICAMLDTIQHRGPDDRGVYLDESVGLGHQRLSIIDIEGGHQPMATEDGQIQVVYNGELYNFRELRKDLERNYRFRTRSDTEVILAAYATWGSACFTQFNGIFALAIWDGRKRQLLLVRDGVGVKPLYYYLDDRKLVFASEIKAILTVPDISRALDPDALDAYLTFRYVPSPRTLLKGVRKLRPGTCLTLNENDVEEQCYSSSESKQGQWLDEADLREQVARRFEEAVERQMVSDVDVGLLLSGGVDSAALLAIMSRYTGGPPVQTFTVGFHGHHEENETAEARRIAAHFGANHREVLMDAVDYREMLPKVISKLEEPLCTTSIIPFYYLTELAGRHVKVALSGQGADEEFAGYTRYVGERLGGIYRRIPPAIRALVASAVNATPVRSEVFRRGVRALGHECVGQRFVESYSVYSQDERRKLYEGSHLQAVDHSATVDTLREPVAGLDGVDQMLFVDIRLWLPDDLLLYTDKLSMAHSVEVRVPFLDRSFLEFVETIPATWKLRNFRRKYILKESVRPLLPPDVVDRRKKGFPTPMGRWLQGELAGYSKDILLSSDSACSALFDRDVIDRLISDHIRGYPNNERQIFTLLAFEIWHRAFIGSS